MSNPRPRVPLVIAESSPDWVGRHGRRPKPLLKGDRNGGVPDRRTASPHRVDRAVTAPGGRRSSSRD